MLEDRSHLTLRELEDRYAQGLNKYYLTQSSLPFFGLEVVRPVFKRSAPKAQRSSRPPGRSALPVSASAARS